jgi:hypothetical protein
LSIFAACLAPVAHVPLVWHSESSILILILICADRPALKKALTLKSQVKERLFKDLKNIEYSNLRIAQVEFQIDKRALLRGIGPWFMHSDVNA